jgi:hypothetical protein
VNKVIMRFAVELELDASQLDAHPDVDEVVLQIERSLTERNGEFGIVDAFAVGVEDGEWHPAIRRRFVERRNQAAEGKREV